MKREIENVLKVLIGLPLSGAARAADMEMFDFGETHTIITKKGKPKDIGEYFLHIQCAWRVIKGDQVIVASRDLYYPANGSSEVPDNFDWDQQNSNWRDIQINTFLENHKSNPLIVTLVEAGKAGGISISFSEDYVLEIFPDHSIPGEYSEYWRFFKGKELDSHLVIGVSGIEE